MATFSLDHLDSVEFEEFCYDLLVGLGFVNVSWRKGTGLSYSPSDQGRDIECQWTLTDIDEERRFEKWFVECKHNKQGVPPTAIQGVLTWAEAEDPDVVLIIASEFLSNPTNNYLEKYIKNRNPRFRIKTWERPDIEELTLGKSRLLRKYKIVGEFPILSILHPAHVIYIKKVPINTLDYLFKILDMLDPKKRDLVFSWIYSAIIKPKATYYTSIVGGMEITVRDKILEEVSYEAFKSKCYQIASVGIIDEPLLVFLIVNWVLHWHLGISDITSVDEFIRKMESQIDLGRRILANKPEDKKLRDLMKKSGIDTSDKEFFKDMISFGQERAENIEKDVKRNYELYEYFCMNVIKPLLLQRSFFE